jgi:hypothetical protein
VANFTLVVCGSVDCHRHSLRNLHADDVNEADDTDERREDVLPGRHDVSERQ